MAVAVAASEHEDWDGEDEEEAAAAEAVSPAPYVDSTSKGGVGADESGAACVRAHRSLLMMSLLMLLAPNRLCCRCRSWSAAVKVHSSSCCCHNCCIWCSCRCGLGWAVAAAVVDIVVGADKSPLALQFSVLVAPIPVPELSASAYTSQVVKQATAATLRRRANSNLDTWRRPVCRKVP